MDFESGSSLCFTRPYLGKSRDYFSLKRCLLSLERIPLDVSISPPNPLRQTLRHAGMDMFSEEFEEIDVAFQSPSDSSCDALIAIGGSDGSDDQFVIPIIIHVFYLLVIGYVAINLSGLPVGLQGTILPDEIIDLPFFVRSNPFEEFR